MRNIAASVLVLAVLAASAQAAGPVQPTAGWPVDQFGRTMVPFVDTAELVRSNVPANSIGVIADGHAMTGGWSSFVVTFQSSQSGGLPMSGIAEARMVGIAPTGMVDQSIDHFSTQPSGYGTITPALKGFHICAQNGCITVMLDGSGSGSGKAYAPSGSVTQ